MTVYVFTVGPFEDGTRLYVPMGDGESTDLDPVRATDDVDGLREILGHLTTEDLVCSPELRTAADVLGLPSKDLPADLAGTRVQIAIDNAQNHAMDRIESAWSHLRLMTATRDFLNSGIASRWPARQSFDIELRGDRCELLAGWISAGAPESVTTVTVVRSQAEAKSLALSSAEEQVHRLSTLDHVSVGLVRPPEYALELIEAFYGIAVMPTFEKVEGGEPVLPTDEDALLMAGVLSALAMSSRVNEVAHSTTETPGRNVRTFVAAGAPFPFVNL